MECPKCGFKQPDNYECVKCRIIIEKYLTKQKEKPQLSKKDETGSDIKKESSKKEKYWNLSYIRHRSIIRNEQTVWLLAEDSGKTGPFTYTELQQRYTANEINGNTLCYPKSFFGAAGWRPLSYYFPDFQSKKGTLEKDIHQGKSEVIMLGWLFLVCGLVGLLLSLNIETTIRSEGYEVHNIGLLNRKQNFVIATGFLSLIGVGLIVIGIQQKRREHNTENMPENLSTSEYRSCPSCAEPIRTHAKICRYCNHELPPDTV